MHMAHHDTGGPERRELCGHWRRRRQYEGRESKSREEGAMSHAHHLTRGWPDPQP
jgi:hypothetical protein